MEGAPQVAFRSGPAREVVDRPRPCHGDPGQSQVSEPCPDPNRAPPAGPHDWRRRISHRRRLMNRWSMSDAASAMQHVLHGQRGQARDLERIGAETRGRVECRRHQISEQRSPPSQRLHGCLLDSVSAAGLVPATAHRSRPPCAASGEGERWDRVQRSAALAAHGTWIRHPGHRGVTVGGQDGASKKGRTRGAVAG